MSQPANHLPRYLTGFTACDVAKLTGLPIFCRPRLKGFEEPVHPRAAEEAIQRGAWRPDDVVMDLTRIEPWDQWRVAMTMIGGYYYLDVGESRLAA